MNKKWLLLLFRGARRLGNQGHCDFKVFLSRPATSHTQGRVFAFNKHQQRDILMRSLLCLSSVYIFLFFPRLEMKKYENTRAEAVGTPGTAPDIAQRFSFLLRTQCGRTYRLCRSTEKLASQIVQEFSITKGWVSELSGPPTPQQRNLQRIQAVNRRYVFCW